MLRVSVIPQVDSVTIKLEGKLLAPWCDELAAICRKAINGVPLRIDLYDVTYVDAAGTDLIRSLLAQGAQLGRCSSFVAELLKPERI